MFEGSKHFKNNRRACAPARVRNAGPRGCIVIAVICFGHIHVEDFHASMPIQPFCL